MRLVLDSEAIVALLEPAHNAHALVRKQLAVAARLDREVCIASVTLAELYRGAGRSRALDALLARLGVEADDNAPAVALRHTDRGFARLVASLLYEAGFGSAQLADAHAVAVVVEAGGGIVLTADPGDLNRLAAGHPRVVVAPL